MEGVPIRRPFGVIRRLLFGATVPFACLPNAAPPPDPEVVTRVDTVVVTESAEPDPELQETVARLQLQIYERDAQITDLQRKLDQAIDELVRSMARQQSLASRAEAASAIAEAEIAITALNGSPGATGAPEHEVAANFLRMSNEQFDAENFGGAVYLATEARSAARRGTSRLASADTSGAPGETLFALPVRLETIARSNVRSGPGLGFPVQFTLDPGITVTGHGFVDSWVRISDAEGRRGWIFHALVTGYENR